MQRLKCCSNQNQSQRSFAPPDSLRAAVPTWSVMAFPRAYIYATCCCFFSMEKNSWVSCSSQYPERASSRMVAAACS